MTLDLHGRGSARVMALAGAAAAFTLVGATATPGGRPSAVEAGPSGGGRGGDGDWAAYQKDLSGSRHNGAERAITPANVGRLKLKWAFAHTPAGPGLTTSGQPAVVGGNVYIGGLDGKFYALDARTGRTRWTFDLSTVAPGMGSATVRNSPVVSDGKVVFGDARGYLYALDQGTGKLLWASRLDAHPTTLITGSPIAYKGRIYVGVSSGESAAGKDYPCCTFRGHVDAVDAATGRLTWRYYTVPEPRQTGTWPSGAARYEPSGGAVWSSPAIDPRTGTLYVGTGQNYTGTEGDSDSVLALSTETGAVRWKRQLTHPDTWRLLCNDPGAPPAYCPGSENGTALDFDIGSLPNLFSVRGRPLVGVGQKSGVYHVLDARSGAIVWQRRLAVPKPGDMGLTGIQFGGAYDGRRLYAATSKSDPGTLYALDPAAGDVLWKTPNPADGCTTGGAARYPGVCFPAHVAAVTASPGLVYEGSTDGKVRAYAAGTGRVVWEYDTIRDFDGVNGLPGRGGAVSGTSGGVVVSGGMLYVQSGYRPSYPSDRGFVLLAFGH